jgi:hypothetical protein
MNKFLAVVALCATSLAVPVVPVQAAPVLTDAQANCLIFPMFKKECWHMGAETMTSATKKTADAALDIKVPVKWWECKTAPKGSKYLLVC